MQVEEWARAHQAAWKQWQHNTEGHLASGSCEEADIEQMLDDAGQFAFGTAAIDLAAVQRVSARLEAALEWAKKVDNSPNP